MSPEPDGHHGQVHDQPAAHLIGLELSGGWRVTERREPRPGSTGGFFSIGYLAERQDPGRVGRQVDGSKAFVKALDLSGWRNLSQDLPTAVSEMSEAFIFERTVVEECAGRRMANIIRGITSGQVEVGEGPFATVNYLILELAEGDLRASLDAVAEMDSAWALRMLHDIANGLRQLHSAGISHQDLKPSNVLTFPELAKVGDLGRAFWTAQQSPHRSSPIPGDINYAAPEHLYGYDEGNQVLRSRALDAYHLGSMVRFMFTKVGATASLWLHLDSAFYPGQWYGTFEEVLPHLREAFDAGMEDFRARLYGPLESELSAVVRQLCDPDPALRGVPRRSARALDRFSMEYYVSILDLLSKKAGIRARQTLS